MENIEAAEDSNLQKSRLKFDVPLLWNWNFISRILLTEKYYEKKANFEFKTILDKSGSELLGFCPSSPVFPQRF